MYEVGHSCMFCPLLCLNLLLDFITSHIDIR